MAKVALIVYESLDNFVEKKSYWKEYIAFYENYWGQTTSPCGVWFGKEYEICREALSSHLEIDEQEIEDCFFMKDKESRNYICPLDSKTNMHLLSSENYIPLDWFTLFKDEERKFFYTH